MNEPLMPNVLREGQEYVDTPATEHQATHRFMLSPSGVAIAVREVFGHRKPAPIQVNIVRERLRWIKPDGTPKSFP